MRWVAAGVLVLGCGQSATGGAVPKLTPARIEYRESALGMFRWAPPPLPPEPAPPAGLLASQVPLTRHYTEPVALRRPVWSAAELERRAALAADWSTHAGPGIAAVQTFGDGQRGLIAYGPGCSNEWLRANVEPIWPALVQHGFLTMHCQGDGARWVWPRRQ